MAPLDTVKIRLQLLLVHSEKLSASQTVAKLLRNEGVAALWKGNVPAEILYVLYGGSQFASYAIFDKFFCQIQKDYNFNLPSLLHSLAVGCVSGLSSTMVTYPFDLLRTQLAASSTKQFVGMTTQCKQIYSQHGVAGFFVGLRPSLLTIVASSGVFFMSYSVARDAAELVHKKMGHNIWGVEAVCGFIAGSISKAVTFPLDTIRKRMQVNRPKLAIAMLSTHWGIHGIRGFYSGFTISVLKTAPTSALSMAIYEYTIQAIN